MCAVEIVHLCGINVLHFELSEGLLIKIPEEVSLVKTLRSLCLYGFIVGTVILQ